MLLTIVSSLVACQTTGSVGTSKSVSCAAFKPIYWSKLDTLDTQKQATEHNAAWSALCKEVKQK
jgi:hypothetical protein